MKPRSLFPTILLFLAAVVVAVWTRSILVGGVALLMLVFWGTLLLRARR